MLLVLLINLERNIKHICEHNFSKVSMEIMLKEKTLKTLFKKELRKRKGLKRSLDI